MTSKSDISAMMGADFAPAVDTPRAAPAPAHSRATATASQPRAHQPRKYKKPPLRSRARAARWSNDPSVPPTRRDQLQVRRWHRVAPPPDARDGSPPATKAVKFDVQTPVPTYDDHVYAQHLTHPDWTQADTDYLITTYRDCNGKWPVIIDHYDADLPRTMEELKARFYSISATLLAIETPMTAMTASEYAAYDVLKSFDPAKEASRKKLAEGHLRRPRIEVDEETVLLSELQRIMLHQATIDSEREDLRRRLQHPHADLNGYQYSTSQALTTLWQQLLAADRIKKTQRLRPLELSTARSSHSAANIPLADNAASTTAATPGHAAQHHATASDLSKADCLRFGIMQAQEKLPTGVSFASDKLAKPRVAKSTVQTEKIAAILGMVGVPELIALPTPKVVEAFEGIMGKVQVLLDLRKLGEKEEVELGVRRRELGG
ncbi:hypothetical protein LTR08_007056 [Meristemomyces frigidus]|nr:hypothetical protein LTR08_007056 [Meristemomyces frigidus]